MQTHAAENNRPHYIVVVGSGYSGSGAVFDYLSGRADVVTAICGKEFRLGIDPGGLCDLGYSVCDGFHPNRASVAVKLFDDLCRRYGRPRKALPPGLGYTELIPQYRRIVDDYIAALTDLEFPAMPVGELTQLDPLRALFVRLVRRLYRRLHKKPPIGKMKLPVGEKEFCRLTGKLVDDLLCGTVGKSSPRSVLVNQAGSLWRPVSSTRWFGSRHIIVVTRDPRDIYADLKSKGYGYPGTSVEEFVRWYKNIIGRISLKEWDNSNVIHVQFEAITSNPNIECQRLVSRLGLDTGLESAYAIEKSYKNVCQYRVKLGRMERELIENELEPHLWDNRKH